MNPNHFPKIKPDKSNIGDPNPRSNTQRTVKIKKNKLIIKKFLFLS
jgi:hypothetical protein